MIECKSKCYYSQLGYCIKGGIKLMPWFLTGPKGNNIYGMRCADYAVIEKEETKTYQTKEEAV